MRAYLTGASGFVGTWLARHLSAMGDEVGALPEGLDVADGDAVAEHLGSFGPDVVYHLAALTHVGQSWEGPSETLRVNVLGTLAVLEACRRLAAPPRVVLVSSAEVYGTGDGEALAETAPLAPVTPYAASKVGAEYLGIQAHLGRGLEVVRARPFNHVGPGQADTFVVSGLARRVVEAERSGTRELRVGNLAAARDFTDVRDVVRAYRLLAEHGAAGEVYNICSGRARTISAVLEALVGLAEVEVVPLEDPALFRPVDLPLLLGDGARLASICDWSPRIALEETLRDTLAWWRERLAAS